MPTAFAGIRLVANLIPIETRVGGGGDHAGSVEPVIQNHPKVLFPIDHLVRPAGSSMKCFYEKAINSNSCQHSRFEFLTTRRQMRVQLGYCNFLRVSSSL